MWIKGSVQTFMPAPKFEKIYLKKGYICWDENNDEQFDFVFKQEWKKHASPKSNLIFF